MSEANFPAPNVESPAESQSTSCCAGAYRTAALRAAVYVPVVLLTSAFAAAAMFPDLAEYATPLIDIGSRTPQAIDFPSASSPPCCQKLGLASPCQGTATDGATSADELPADAMAAVNVTVLETASN